MIFFRSGYIEISLVTDYILYVFSVVDFFKLYLGVSLKHEIVNLLSSGGLTHLRLNNALLSDVLVYI